MTAAALLSVNPEPTDEDIDTAMNGNICRCGTYLRIRQGIRRAATAMAGNGNDGITVQVAEPAEPVQK
jgi:aerobic-type carbon monoxide dehydrogenase small subunit (CoxS/CutS family)